MAKTDRMAASGASPGEVEQNLALFASKLLEMGYAVIRVDDVLNEYDRQIIINVSNDQNRRRRKYASQMRRETDKQAVKNRRAVSWQR